MTDTIDLGRHQLYADGIPYDLFARLRRHAPVHWMEEPAFPGFAGGPGYWAVLRHAEVQAISRHPEMFSSAIGGTTLRNLSPKHVEAVRHMMLNMDPPQHSKLRKIVNRVFTPQVINQLKGSIEAHAREVVDAIVAKGSIDFIDEVAAEMPLLVLADILGVPREDRYLLRRWTDANIAADDPDAGPEATAAVVATIKEMFGYASARTAEKRAKPTNDVWSLVANAEVDGEQLSRGQLDRFFQLLVVAGNETTRSLIGSGLLLLTQHPEQRDMLRKDMSLLPAAIEEILRYAPPVIQFRRTAARDTTLGGQPIAEGDKVVMFYVSANRDETVFAEPDKFNILRNPNPHVSFGDGTHFCLGANLARLEARVILTELMTRLPDLEASGPPVRLRSNFVSNYKSLPARFTPVAPPLRARQDETTARPETAHAAAAAPEAMRTARHDTPLLVLFGSNFGTAEDLARHIGADADGHGFATTVAALDDYAAGLPTDGAVIIVSATYNGTPPDNAAAFLKWLDGNESLTGVNYAVFGCGNRDWATTFQEVPRQIDAALAQRGARRIHERGEGDQSGDFDGQFQTWYKPLWQSLAKELSLDLGAPVVRGPLFSIEIVPGERMSPFVNSLGARPMRITTNRELQSSDGAVTRSTRHIELDLPPGVTYQAGDHLGVIPHNREELVQRVASRFGFERDVFVRLHAQSERRTFLPIGERISLHTLLSDYVELQAVATRAHIQTLAAHVECPFTKPKLEALAADAGALYRDDVLVKRKSVIDLLDEFSSIKLPLEAFLEMLPPLSPRYYSISSSPLSSKDRCSVTVGIVHAPARCGTGNFDGVCSNYLQRQPRDGVVYAFVKDTKSAFRLPSDPATPIIMIGPGTGLAPFRGFLQERAAQKVGGATVGQSLLFFGCRHERQDFIYADELNHFVEQGVTELHVAFSRMQEKKVYVQDHLRRMGDRIFSMIQNGAVIYVCGDATRMEPSVRQALVDILGEKLRIEAAEASRRLNDMIAQNRYLVDVWATG